MVVVRVLGFVAWYAGELLRSYGRMLVDVVAPERHVRPAVVRFDTRCVTETQVGVLGMLITLSPGMVVVDARAHAPTGGDAAPWTLYVHGIHHADPEDLRRSLHDLERRLHGARP